MNQQEVNDLSVGFEWFKSKGWEPFSFQTQCWKLF